MTPNTRKFLAIVAIILPLCLSAVFNILSKNVFGLNDAIAQLATAGVVVILGLISRKISTRLLCVRLSELDSIYLSAYVPYILITLICALVAVAQPQ